MNSIVFENVCKSYGEARIVKSLNLEIKEGERLILLGPSGCGKTTTLRMIAGLEDITSGQLKMGGQVVNDIAPGERNIAMVFQSYALFPHLSVWDNITFGLHIQKLPEAEIKKRADEALSILNLQGYENYKPKQLSGGQKQRVALCRALVKQSPYFLLDEPLSNLDAKLRNQMRAEIIKLRQRIDTTFIYVTHDQTEAMTLGDRIVIMKDGVIQQIGTPEDIYNEPKNAFVADFIGESNILDGVMRADYLAEFSGHRFQCLDQGFQKNEPIDAVVRPEDVDVVPAEEGMLSGTVTSVTFKGVHFEIIVDIGGFKWMIQSTDHQAVGDVIGLKIDPDAIHIMKKSAYSGAFGDYSSFSDELEHLSDPEEEEA